MLAIADVHYASTSAVAACVVAAHWADETPLDERSAQIESVAPYEPGRFYLRELPCLLAVLRTVKSGFEVVVIDGYVDLAPEQPGLGAHLFAELGERAAVVGVAKSAFRGSDHAIAVTRGTSQRPLFVTARGMSAERAAELVRSMHGAHRIPTLIARADALARGRG